MISLFGALGRHRGKLGASLIFGFTKQYLRSGKPPALDMPAHCQWSLQWQYGTPPHLASHTPPRRTKSCPWRIYRRHRHVASAEEKGKASAIIGTGSGSSSRKSGSSSGRSGRSGWIRSVRSGWIRYGRSGLPPKLARYLPTYLPLPTYM